MGEVLILLGAFQKNVLVAAIASLGVILGAAYMLWLYKRVIFGELKNNLNDILDLKKTEIFILLSLAIPILVFGFYPEPLINSIEVSIENLINNYKIDLANYKIGLNE